MKKNVLILTIMGLLLISFSPGYLLASEVDLLINKLVEKSILTQSEATMLLEEMRKEEIKQEEEIKQAAEEAVEEGVKDTFGLPDWIDKIDLSGDLRLRHDTQWKEKDSSDSTRNRERFRLRVGLTSQVTENTEVGFRLASGSGYQNTTNQSFDSHARGKNIFIDRAYASWEPNESFAIVAGKHKNPVFTSALVWDSDVNPDGVSEIIDYSVSDNIKLFGSLSQLFIEELSGSDDDPTLLVFQLGSEIKPNNNMALKVAATYYGFINMDTFEHDDDDIADKETFIGYGNKYGQQMVFDQNGNLLNEWGCLELGAKLSLKELLPLPFSIFGNYIRNLDADINVLTSRGVSFTKTDPADLLVYGNEDRDTGWQVGFDYGNKKKKGDMYMKYFYQVLEDYAFPSVFVDSDFHGGGTNNKGHKIEARYFLSDKIYANAAGYFTERDDVKKDGKFDEDRIQLDIIIKFP